MSKTMFEGAPVMLEISTITRFDKAVQSAGESDRNSDMSDREIANMGFSDYVFFLEEIEHR